MIRSIKLARNNSRFTSNFLVQSIRYCTKCLYSRWERLLEAWIIEASRKGSGLVQCIGALDLLRCCHVSSFIQFLNTWQHFNGSNALLHLTQAFPSRKILLLPVLPSSITNKVGYFLWTPRKKKKGPNYFTLLNLYLLILLWDPC